MEHIRSRFRRVNYELAGSTKPIIHKVFLMIHQSVIKEPTLTPEEIGLLRFEQKLKAQLTQFKHSRNGKNN